MLFILPITSFSPKVAHVGFRSTGDRLFFLSDGSSGSSVLQINAYDNKKCADLHTGTWKEDERSLDGCSVA